MMDKSLNLLAILTMAGAMTAAMAFAATPPADHTPNMPAVVTDKTPEATEPAAGRNSFTEKQADARLLAKGYTKVSTLTVDKDGIWRGTATMNGSKQRVAVDYQGNVTAE